MISFDGTNRIITLDPSQFVYSIQYIYSRWLDWVRLGNNTTFPKAFRQSGGDSIGGGVFVGVYFFLQNTDGWRIKPPEQNGTYSIAGNLYPEDPSIGFLNSTTGTFSTSIRIDSSQSTQVAPIDELANEVAAKFLFDDQGRVRSDATGSSVSGPSLADFSRAVQSAIPSPASPSAIWDSAPKWMKKPPSKTKDYSDAIRSLSNKIDTLYQSFDAIKRQPESVVKEDFDVARLEQQIQGLSDAINAIEIPNGEEGFASLRSLVEPIQGGLDGIQSEIFGVREDISSIPEIDLSSVSKQDSMDEALEALEDAIARIRNYDDTQIKRLLKSVIANTESLTDDISVVEQKADLVLDNQMRQP
jgi:hypothetical protein